jgi:hypothetical protein
VAEGRDGMKWKCGNVRSKEEKEDREERKIMKEDKEGRKERKIIKKK